MMLLTRDGRDLASICTFNDLPRGHLFLSNGLVTQGTLATSTGEGAHSCPLAASVSIVEQPIRLPPRVGKPWRCSRPRQRDLQSRFKGYLVGIEGFQIIRSNQHITQATAAPNLIEDPSNFVSQDPPTRSITPRPGTCFFLQKLRLHYLWLASVSIGLLSSGDAAIDHYSRKWPTRSAR
jgi:hypothetical protein